MGLEWLKCRKIQAGRDPLGIQQINISLYAKLIPGISNVTDRLRYYSFYPWLLTKYKEIEGKLDFVNYIRRAEFLFGFITNYNHRLNGNWSSHAVGGNTISKAIKIIEEQDQLDFSQYTALEESEDRYFKNELGGFGQYYFGQLSQIGIITRKERYKYSVSSLGSRLAESFETGESTELFLQCVQNGKVISSDLERMHDDFCICAISKNRDQYDILFQIMFGADEEFVKQKSYQRQKTLQLLLYLLSKSDREINYFWPLLNMLYFGRDQSHKSLSVPSSLDKISKAWIYYVQHEYLCIGLIALFVGVQHIIIDKALPSEHIIQDCWTKYIEKNDSKSFGLNDKIFELIKSNTRIDKIIAALDIEYDHEKTFSPESFNEFRI